MGIFRFEEGDQHREKRQKTAHNEDARRPPKFQNRHRLGVGRIEPTVANIHQFSVMKPPTAPASDGIAHIEHTVFMLVQECRNGPISDRIHQLPRTYGRQHICGGLNKDHAGRCLNRIVVERQKFLKHNETIGYKNPR